MLGTRAVEVADGSLGGADIDPGTTIDLSGGVYGLGSTTLSGDDGLSTVAAAPHSRASTEVFGGEVRLSRCDSSDCWDMRLSPSVTFTGESRYGSTITLPEEFPDDPPADSALIYVRESGGLTQLVARFADGEIDVLAEEAP